jgi:thymidylate kinase
MDAVLPLLFSTLNSKGIKYALLTDFECDFLSQDIDLFVHPTNRLQFEKVLFDMGWYRRKELAYHVNHHFYISPKSAVYLDVKYGPTFANGKDACYTFIGYDSSDIDVQINSKGVCRPSGFNAIALYAAHLAFKERGKLEEKHRVYLAQYIDLYLQEVDASFLEAVEQIQDWLLHSFPGDTSKLQQIIRPYFRLDKKRMTRPKGIKYGYGLNVLFLGTDGSGKTTLVEAVGSSLNLKNNRLYLGAGESSWTSPIMKKIYDYKFSAKPLDRVYSFLKTFAVLPLELSLRIAPIVRKSKYNITLIDRFPGFVFLDKKPGRALLYKSILPTPDLVFFLYADPEVLVKRKPNETTLERSRQDISKFRKVADVISGGHYKSIDTSKLSVNEARDLVISEIFKHPKLYKTMLTTAPCGIN